MSTTTVPTTTLQSDLMTESVISYEGTLLMNETSFDIWTDILNMTTALANVSAVEVSCHNCYDFGKVCVNGVCRCGDLFELNEHFNRCVWHSTTGLYVFLVFLAITVAFGLLALASAKDYLQQKPNFPFDTEDLYVGRMCR